jgi:Domain of unknown function (DUF4450)
MPSTRFGVFIPRLIFLVLTTAFFSVANASASAPIDNRPLRCWPDGKDFVITNGAELFNRPLYAGHEGFRVEAGDRPEFAFFLPGRGGNIRLGLLPSNSDASKAIWLTEAQTIVARYRPGSVIYEIGDPLLGSCTLTLTAIPLADAEGLMVRLAMTGTAPPLKLLVAYGGANLERGRRNGDLGGERVPSRQFWQLRPEYCRSNEFRLRTDGFTLPTKIGTMMGISSSPQKPALADAGKWTSPGALLASVGKATKTPVLIQEFSLDAGTEQFMAFQLVPTGQSPKLRATNLPEALAVAENHRRELVSRLSVETPDDYINVAAAAVSVAADAIWDEKEGTFMHGANAWRVKLLGWRGPYAGDELGWPDRTARHFATFAAKQNTNPIAEVMPLADEEFNLARSEAALHSNGDFSVVEPHHYDMNLVAVDVFFRHLLWTGDLDFARRMWPVIERHLAWERRLFRRPFGAEPLPLYEAYCCIWASDDLQYSGGGATHATAYNYWHNLMAARVAKLLGKDATPYEREADLIQRAMQRELWLTDRGWFGEFKDYLGLQAVHPNAALWTFYHTVDSQAATPQQAWQMSRFVDTQIPHILLTGSNVPPDCYEVSTTSWMPYLWSINNVALEESAHTALGLWQAGRADAAFPLLKGALLDSMFLGICPGNVGMTTALDQYSGEKYRDFADSIGITARAFVEGLFGIAPDQLAGELRIRPGFPAEWNHARIGHPDLDFEFSRDGLKETFLVEQKFSKPMSLRLQIAALCDEIVRVIVNGQPAQWRNLSESVGTPRIEIIASPAARNEIVVEWRGENPQPVAASQIVALGQIMTADFGTATVSDISDPQAAVTNIVLHGNIFSATAVGALGHRTLFARVEEGSLKWWQPVVFEIRPPLEIIAASEQDAAHLHFRLRNNTTNDMDSEAAIRFGGRVANLHISARSHADSGEIVLAADDLSPGTQPVSVDFGNGEKVEGVVVNWLLKPSRSSAKWEPVNLAPFFNDRVTQIFSNEYRSPRSPFCSLALPKQGIGAWCDYKMTADIDDSGLRASAASNGGVFQSALGVPFQTPGEVGVKNIIFTSQWDNYPREVSVPLTGRASRADLLMAGSANPMQSRFDNGELVVTYADGSTDQLVLRTPETWWPIEQDYFIDDFAFARPEPIPPRVNLKTGQLRIPLLADCIIKNQIIPGGAATVLDLPLNPAKELRSLTLRTFGNELIIGLMAVTLAREKP